VLVVTILLGDNKTALISPALSKIIAQQRRADRKEALSALSPYAGIRDVYRGETHRTGKGQTKRRPVFR
jgi:hypothetical protein